MIRTGRRSATSRRPLQAAFLGAMLLAGASARADTPEEAAARAAGLVLEATPVLGNGAQFYAGWNEFLVRIENAGGAPARGEVVVTTSLYANQAAFTARAPYAVGAGNAVHVRVPVDVLPYSEIVVQAADERGVQLLHRRFTPGGTWGVLLVDVSEPSHLRAPLHETHISPDYMPSGASSSGPAPTLLVSAPRFDPSTGDPILPDRAALYSSASAVLMRTDTLARVGGAELEALAGYVSGGGTLALVMARPEDMRNPTVAALVGGEVTQTAPSSEVLRELHLPPSGGTGEKTIPYARNPGEEVGKALAGYAGGNLHGSAYGNSAHYGLGEVHLLAFDPTRKPGVDDPWVQARMVDMARAAFDRRSTLVFRPGSPSVDDLSSVRRQLDPNEGSRWAIAASALLLCVYAVIAGPVNFATASAAGRPLRALRWLPIFSAIAFAIVVAMGIAAKGVRGRARHLTLVEAGAGTTRGAARRWRGFYASSAKELTVRTSDPGAVLRSAVGARDELDDRLRVDRDGVRLEEVAALPWQTVVVREDGAASLGDGISIVRGAGPTDATVINRSGRDLRAAILTLPAGSPRYFARIKDGESVSSAAGVMLDGVPEAADWLLHIRGGTTTSSGLVLHGLGAWSLRLILEADAPKLADAWSAIEAAAGPSVDWFPTDVPVLLGQLDGGEGKTSDSGLKLESDRLLVRLVGYGGRP